MARNVAGDTKNTTYYRVDGQLHEIKRQMRQGSGCGANLVRLKHALQPIVENTFDTLGSLLYRFIGIVVGLHPAVLLGLDKETIEKNTIAKFGEPLLDNIIVPVKMKDGTYRLVQYHDCELLYVHFPDFDVDEFFKEAIDMPIVAHICDGGLRGNLWGVIISNGMCRKQMEFSLYDGVPQFHSTTMKL